MKLGNSKTRKAFFAMLTAGSIALTGAAHTSAADNTLNEILSSADGYETIREYDQPSFLKTNNQEVAIQTPVEEPVEEDVFVETEAETEKVEASNLLNLLNEEANQAVLDYFLQTDEILVDFINGGDEDDLTIKTQGVVAEIMDFLFFGGSISNYKKEQVSKETLETVMDNLNLYIEQINEWVPFFMNTMEPKYQEAYLYLDPVYVDQLDEKTQEIMENIEEEETMTLK